MRNKFKPVALPWNKNNKFKKWNKKQQFLASKSLATMGIRNKINFLFKIYFIDGKLIHAIKFLLAEQLKIVYIFNYEIIKSSNISKLYK